MKKLSYTTPNTQGPIAPTYVHPYEHRHTKGRGLLTNEEQQMILDACPVREAPAMAVLNVLARRADGDSRWCCPGEERISRESCFSVRTVVRAVKKLEAAGVIAVRRSKDAPNCYRIILAVAVTVAPAPAQADATLTPGQVPQGAEPCATVADKVIQGSNTKKQASACFPSEGARKGGAVKLGTIPDDVFLSHPDVKAAIRARGWGVLAPKWALDRMRAFPSFQASRKTEPEWIAALCDWVARERDNPPQLSSEYCSGSAGSKLVFACRGFVDTPHRDGRCTIDHATEPKCSGANDPRHGVTCLVQHK